MDHVFQRKQPQQDRRKEDKPVDPDNERQRQKQQRTHSRRSLYPDLLCEYQ